MRYFMLPIAAAALLAYGSTVMAADTAKPAPATAAKIAAKPLQLGDLGGVKAWQVGEKDTIVYVQAQDSAWYRVDTYETCMKFVTDKGIRFVTEVDDTGERVSKVIVDRYICQVLEITKVDAPVPRQAAK